MSRYAPGLNIYSSVGTGFLYLSDSFAFDTRTGTTRVTMTSWAPGRHRKSITTQIYLSVVFVVALLFLSMEFYRLDEDIKQMKATIEEKVQLMADSYVTIVSGMLWSLNHDLMEPSLSGLMLVSGFDYATVTLPEGERLVSIGSPPPLGTVPDPGRNVCATRELNWQTAREVAYLGMLNICMNLDELKDYRDQHIKDALVSVAGIALGLGGFLFLVIRRITAPLVRITNSVEELSQGRRTAQILSSIVKMKWVPWLGRWTSFDEMMMSCSPCASRWKHRSNCKRQNWSTHAMRPRRVISPSHAFFLPCPTN